ncbi:MAG TPA: chemotaxis protein CheD [Deltaproteobacteria bacterium]|nr:chemotaxis protein CheD [Deltaproteobacteria bacterium]
MTHTPFAGLGSRSVGVGIGEYAVASNGELVTHALGSCIAVCLWDSRRHLGGLLHLMLPSSVGRGNDRPALYADSGIKLLIEGMKAKGANLRITRAYLIGGSSLAGTSVFAVGQRNIIAARRSLYANRIIVAGEDVGGNIPRSVRMHVLDGQIIVTSPGLAARVFQARHP